MGSYSYRGNPHFLCLGDKMTKKNNLQLKKRYNVKNKNRLREFIVEKIRERNISSILTLESKEFLFSKMLPEKKIIVWENNANIYKQMEKHCPKNVDLIFGNIGKFGVIGKQVNCIYLDFCRTWFSEQSEIVRLKEKLKETKLFILTLCLREPSVFQKEGKVFNGDYQFDLLNKIQNLTEVNWKVVYGESYYDSVQMVTIILENSEVKE